MLARGSAWTRRLRRSQSGDLQQQMPLSEQGVSRSLSPLVPKPSQRATPTPASKISGIIQIRNSTIIEI